MHYENRQYDCRMQTLTLKILWITDILVNSDDNKLVENDDSNDFYSTTCLILGNTGTYNIIAGTGQKVQQRPQVINVNF